MFFCRKSLTKTFSLCIKIDKETMSSMFSCRWVWVRSKKYLRKLNNSRMHNWSSGRQNKALRMSENLMRRSWSSRSSSSSKLLSGSQCLLSLYTWKSKSRKSVSLEFHSRRLVYKTKAESRIPHANLVVASIKANKRCGNILFNLCALPTSTRAQLSPAASSWLIIFNSFSSSSSVFSSVNL